jgi:hypothetical protein
LMTGDLTMARNDYLCRVHSDFTWSAAERGRGGCTPYSSSNSFSSLTLSLGLYRCGSALRQPSDPVTKG